MQPQVFAGTYADAHGLEQIVWRVGPSRHWGSDRFDVRTVIRGIPVAGADFDGLEPHDTERARQAGLCTDPWDNIEQCVLTGELPCTLAMGGESRPGAVHFRLDLPRTKAGESLELTVQIDGTAYCHSDSWFEGALLGLERALPGGVRLMSCVTCLFSDYSPNGHGLTGMWCHREAKDRYLAVRSKDDYFDVPVTEQVPETYLCPEYQRRVPGTGYRG